MKAGDIMDIRFDENGNEVKLKPIFYSQKQLAEELGETYSTIRYWSEKFDDYLEIDLKSWKKEFSERDFRVIKDIQAMLREQKLTIKQVQDWLRENIGSYDSLQYTSSENIDNNSFSINKVIDNRINERLEDFKAEFKDELITEVTSAIENKLVDILKVHFVHTEDTIKSVNDNMSNKIAEVQKEVAATIEESIEKSSKEINKTLDQIKKASAEKDLEISNQIREALEKKNKEIEEVAAANKNKGFFARVFGK